MLHTCLPVKEGKEKCSSTCERGEEVVNASSNPCEAWGTRRIGGRWAMTNRMGGNIVTPHSPKKRGPGARKSFVCKLHICIVRLLRCLGSTHMDGMDCVDGWMYVCICRLVRPALCDWKLIRRRRRASRCMTSSFALSFFYLCCAAPRVAWEETRGAAETTIYHDAWAAAWPARTDRGTPIDDAWALRKLGW